MSRPIVLLLCTALLLAVGALVLIDHLGDELCRCRVLYPAPTSVELQDANRSANHAILDDLRQRYGNTPSADWPEVDRARYDAARRIVEEEP